jgi:hypothetical protein
LEKITYWKKNEHGEKIYYYDYKEIGGEWEMAKFIVSNNRISNSNAHKIVRKIKELKVNKK